jgi:hypothetical protein
VKVTLQLSIITALSLAMSIAACSDDEASSEGSKHSDAGSDASTEPAKHQAAGDETAKTSSQNKPIQDDASNTLLKALPTELRPEKLLPDLAKQVQLPKNLDNVLIAFTGTTTVPAGSDVTFCTYTPIITKKRMFAHDSKGLQTKYGHHAILQYTMDHKDPGTHECKSESLEAQQAQVINGQSKEGSGGINLAKNVVSEVPEGAQIVINHHWINTSDKDAEAQAAVITEAPPDDLEEKDLMIARSFIVMSTNFKVDAQTEGEASVDCKLEEDVKLVTAGGHAHEWATHVKGQRLGSASDVVFDDPYTEDNVTHPTIWYYEADKPYTMNKGDTVRMTCKWMNTTDAPLTFPGEMCVFVGWRIGAEKDSRCVDGNWLTF